MGVESIINFFNQEVPRVILIVCACIFGFVILRSILPQIWKLFLGLFKGKPDEMTRLSQKILKHEIRVAKLKFLTIGHIITALLVVAFLNFIGIIPGLMLNLESKYQITILIVLGIGFFVAYGIGYFKNPSDLVDFSGMYQDYLPANYVTVTTTEYEKWDYESSWTEKGTSAYTRDQNALDNASSMILNVIMMVIQIVFILFHILWFAICSWFDTLRTIYEAMFIKSKTEKLKKMVEQDFNQEVARNEKNVDAPYLNSYELVGLNPVLSACKTAFVNGKLKKTEDALESEKDSFLFVRKARFYRYPYTGKNGVFCVKQTVKKLATISKNDINMKLYLCENGLLLVNPENKKLHELTYESMLYFLPFKLHTWDINVLKKENDIIVEIVKIMQYYYLKYVLENKTTESVVLAQVDETQGYSIRVKCEDVILDHEKQTYLVKKYERV